MSRQIGVGGMATVYLAHDLRHERDVAIKVLHPDLAAALGAERFLAEIKTTAKLQHSHILPLLDSGEADGLLYYVMPYIEGESLRVRLDRETQLAVDDAVRMAREVASALDYAHRHGVVHRDIKPENILLHEDQALVADFGIALAVSAAGGARMTQTGLSLGTPQYMAPEQAVGERAIDGRADIYALGAVLYEMLVGEAPFTGPTVQAIVARVMTEQPRAVTGQRRSVPAHVNAAVLRALEKIPADRFHSAAEFSSALVTPGFTLPEETSAKKTTTKAPQRMVADLVRRPTVAWSVAGLAIAAAIVLGLRYTRTLGDRAVTQLAVELAPGMRLLPDAGSFPALTADGRILAFTYYSGGSRGHLALRRLDSPELRVVPGSDGANGGPSFSPDGKSLVFNADGKLYKTLVAGGPPTQIGRANWAHTTWAGNDAVIYTFDYDDGLRRVSADGRDSAVLTRPDRKRGELGHWWPQTLPDGDHILFSNYTTPADRSRVEVLSLKSGKRDVVLEGGYFGRYLKGQLLFVRGEVVLRVPFDAKRLKVTGSPVPVGLDANINPTNGTGGFSVAPDGTLAYLRKGSDQIEVVWISEQGNEQQALDSVGRISSVEASPDGRKIALVRDGDVWIYDIQRRLYTRLTRSEQQERDLVWTPDSRDVLYVRDVPQFDVFRRPADASRPEELVLTSPRDKSPSSVSPDGRTLLYDFFEAGSEDDIWAVSVVRGEASKPLRILGGTGRQINAEFSPDGKWIAYQSNESGRSEVYIAPYPVDRGPTRVQVSANGGEVPRWANDGRSVYYWSAGRLLRGNVNPESGDVGTPQPLPRIERLQGWSLGPDGRLLIRRTPENAASQSLNVILNWASTLEH